MRGRSIGMILLAIYLILVGVLALGVAGGAVIPGTGLLMGLLAAAAGICILLGK